MNSLFKPTVVFVGSLILAFALFGVSLHFGFFIFDDGELIFANQFVKGASWQNIFEYWARSNTPIIFNVWQLVSMKFGVAQAAPYRVVNLIFHAINCGLVYLWCREMLKGDLNPSNDLEDDKKFSHIEKASIFGLLIYALHPVHVEAVVWVSSLKEVLSTTFGLVSFLFYFKSARQKDIKFEILTVLTFLLGLLVHPTIAALPLLYIWLDYTMFNKNLREIVQRNGVFFIILMAAVVIHKTVNPQTDPLSEDPIYIRISVALNSWLLYLEKALVPLSYSFDYMQSPSDIAKATQMEMWPKIKAFVAGILIWSLALLYRHKRFRFIHYSLASLTLLVIVNLGLVGYAFQNISTVADRFLYFPSIGISLLVAYLAYFFMLEATGVIKKISGGALTIILGVFLTLTVQRTLLWNSSAKVLSESVNNGFESYPLNISLGVSFLNMKEYDQALLRFDLAHQMVKMKDVHGNKVLGIDENEVLAHIFSVLKLTKDAKRGLKLYEYVRKSDMVISPVLAWTMIDFLIEVRRWNEVDGLLSFIDMIFPQSEKVKKQREQVMLIKKAALIDSLVVIGVNQLDENKFEEARKTFEEAIVLRKKHKLEYDDLTDLIKKIEVKKKFINRKPKK